MFFLSTHQTKMSGMPGGNSAAQSPTGPEDEIYEILKTPGIKNALGVEELNVHSYTTQVVAGTRYQVKLSAGDGSFWHFSIIKPLPHTGEAPFIQAGKYYLLLLEYILCMVMVMFFVHRYFSEG